LIVGSWFVSAAPNWASNVDSIGTVDDGVEPTYGCFFSSGFTQEPFGPAN
jgi:hypothetical protein